MEVEYGAEVLDKNGKSLGKIDYIIRIQVRSPSSRSAWI
jgi:hypothetical protein